ncbi:MAG: sensor histidine kinase [Clostridia bacterium]|nr:sensor histidine kinase [Clostridia bacterium]
MNINEILLSVIEIVAIVPIGLICLLIFDKDSIIPRPQSIFIYTGVFTLLACIGGYLRTIFELNINLVILSVFFPMVIYIILTVKVNKFKILYVFASCGAISSSIRLYSYFLETQTNSNHTFRDTQHWGLLLKWILIIIAVIFFALSVKKIRWLMYESSLDNLWKFLWLIPVAQDTANMMTIPHDYSLMQMGRVAQIYVTVVTALTLMEVVFQVMIYVIAKTITEKTKLDKQAQMLSIQASQYEGLQRHIEATSKLRHDFKHTVRTAASLAQEGKNDELIKLLSDYGVVTESTDKRSVFTKNSTLNALICYYYEQALSKNIFCNWKVSLPEKLGVEDIDLFGIIGNLLENAIHASENEHPENRYINLKADVEDNGDIYIVTTNGFSGKIQKDHDKYLSTKKDGSGIGIESIKSTVKRYNGIASFYNDPKTFYADIMLKQNPQ